MFPKEIYIKRRRELAKIVGDGLLIFPGNHDVPFNYPANIYLFRQDSSFLYFFGVNNPDMFGIIDTEADEDILFGNDIDIDDIIWMGEQPKLSEYGEKVGIKNTMSMQKVDDVIKKALSQGRKIHYLNPYRASNKLQLEALLGIPAAELENNFSLDLTQAVIQLRSIKDKYEIDEIERTVDVAYEMHTAAMKMAKPGVVEAEIAGRIEGIALSNGGPVSFPVILSQDGQILHNHNHNNILEEGRLMVTDAGAESPMRYTSDITRTIPVSGTYTDKQKAIYETVLKANTEAIKMLKPGVFYKDIHLAAATIITTRLKDIGLMKGDVDEAVRQGAHALFFPHGLGHMMGMDVHDLEGLGETNVGYDSTVERSDQFGLAFLRLAKALVPGNILTIEPGIYFIPALIDIWKNENKFTEFINYEMVDKYRDFGGIRIEDDILITETGHRLLGKPIPKTVNDIQEMMKQSM